ncbi:UPF0183-domain-containing protein [Coprinopsis marcescibilis]|uniref:UPF0183-domain-containing protein n=1 Tax=Coprinopsis marcescibilis TaxID=230819 RepID=A0A5C3KTS7_COPMA|nr:UPF0183-domain-containing protein [Coprinopsis marcescibilis]
MYSTLDVDIRPGLGLGIFDIGASLWMVLDRLRNLQHIFPQIEVKYDPDASAITPIILHVRPHLDLLFSGKGQRLHTICVRKLRDPNPPVTLRYKDKIISSDNVILRRVVVNRTFGPTYPGDELRYPGLWFSFEDDAIGEGALQGLAGADKTQEVKRVFISQKGNDGKVGDALEEVKECPLMTGDISRAILKIHDGIVLHFYGHANRILHMRIGETTAQDLTLDLGPPLRVHYKEDERMAIHSATKKSNPDEDGAYFYNYFQHGLDFLMDGATHIVRKIVVHTNLPGSPLFQRYKRCYWEIEGTPEDDEDDSPPRKRFYDRFETISHFLSPREPPPSMHLDRTDEEENLTLPSPATRLYGYDGIFLEVTESSQIVSVVLF